MKLRFFFWFICVSGCHTAAISTMIQSTANGSVATKLMPLEPTFDAKSLRITVVHNPQYPNHYGVELANLDTFELIEVQKVILGKVEKYYPIPCTPETEEQRINRADYDFCRIHQSPPVRFEMKILDPVPNPLKCEVYYIIGGVRKVNFTFKVDTMTCIIGSSRGVHSEPGAPCIWAIFEGC